MYAFLLLGHRGASHDRILCRSRSTVSERARTSCRHGEIERKGRNVEGDWRRSLRLLQEGGATPEFLLELHQQNTLTLNFPTMKLYNGHTVQTTDKKVTPNSKLFQVVDMSDMDGDVDLNFSSLVDEGTKTVTMWTVPGVIYGTLSPPSSSRSCSCDVCAHSHIVYNVTHTGQLPKPKYTKSLKQRTTQ